MNRPILPFSLAIVITIFSCTQTNWQNLSKDSAALKGNAPGMDSSTSKRAAIRIGINPEHYPSNYVVTEMGPDCEEECFYFYRDSSVAVENMYGNNEFKFGKWKKTSDSIIMMLNYQTGFHGYELVDNEKYLDSMGVDRCGPRSYLFLFPYENEINEKKGFRLSDFKDFDWMRVDSFHYAEEFPIANFHTHIDGSYTFISKRFIDSYDLKKYLKTELRLIKNEIFARYHYIFKSDDLNKYFQQQGWYMPKYENVDRYITDIERANIKFLNNYMKSL